MFFAVAKGKAPASQKATGMSPSRLRTPQAQRWPSSSACCPSASSPHRARTGEGPEAGRLRNRRKAGVEAC